MNATGLLNEVLVTYIIGFLPRSTSIISSENLPVELLVLIPIIFRSYKGRVQDCTLQNPRIDLSYHESTGEHFPIDLSV